MTLLGQLRDANRAARQAWTPEQEERAFHEAIAPYVNNVLEHRTEHDVAELYRWLDADVAVSGKTSGRALDLGAGEGRSTQRLRDLGFDAIGVERSPQLAARAPDGMVRVGDAQAIPVEDASMDLVICNSLMEHVLDPPGVLRELRRVTAPGGVCVLHTTNKMHWMTGEIAFPGFQWLPKRLQAIIWHASGRRHISPHFFTYSGLAAQARAAGWDDVYSTIDWRRKHRALSTRTGWKAVVVNALYRTPIATAALMVRSPVVELHLRA